MIHHRPNRVKRMRNFRIELLEQRIALSGMNLLAINNGDISPKMIEHPRQETLESVHRNIRPTEGLTHHNGASGHAPVNRPANDLAHHSGRSNQRSVHAEHIPHMPPAAVAQTSGNETGRQNSKWVASLSPAWPALEGQRLLSGTPLNSEFPNNGLLFETPTFVATSLIDAKPQPLYAPTGIPTGDPNFLLDPVFSFISQTDPGLALNISDQFSTAAPTLSDPQFPNINPKTGNTTSASVEKNRTTDESSQVGSSTSAQRLRTPTTADVRQEIARSLHHPNTAAVRTCPALKTLQDTTRTQVTPNERVVPELTKHSIQQQLNDLEDMLQTLAMSREVKTPSSNTQTEVANNGSDKPQEAKHNRHPVSLSAPMTILISVNHARDNFTTSTQTDAELAHDSAQWGIPLARHRTITSTILRGVYFEGTRWSRASVDGTSVKHNPSEIREKRDNKQEPAIDTKQQPMSLAPPGTLGLAIACCVLLRSFIRRKHPRQQTATLPPR